MILSPTLKMMTRGIMELKKEWEKTLRAKRMQKANQRTLDNREQAKLDREWAKLPPWVQAEIAGDYLPEDSGMNVGDRE